MSAKKALPTNATEIRMFFIFLLVSLPVPSRLSPLVETKLYLFRGLVTDKFKRNAEDKLLSAKIIVAPA